MIEDQNWLFNFLYRVVEEEERDSDVLIGLRRRRIFTPAVTIWLMIQQRLKYGASLSKITDELSRGNLWIKQFEGKEISSNTAGYAQARGRLRVEEVLAVAERLNGEINEIQREAKIGDRRVFLVDGTTFSLPREKELQKEFPPCPSRGKYQASRFPIANVALAVDAYTGVASCPEIGAMYGKKAIHETKLILPVLQKLPEGSIVIGDRSFGGVAVALHAQAAGHDVIVRMNECRVPWLCGGKAKLVNGEMAVCWKVSKHARVHNPGIPVEATVKGRYIEATVSPNGFKSFKLKLFTTLELPVDEVVKLYALRWNVELDLRTLKHVTDLDNLTSRSVPMVKKEIIIGFVSYNLVRNIVAYAAKLKNVHPRRISFSRALNFIHLIGNKLPYCSNSAEMYAQLARLLDIIPALIIPQRKNRPPEPRKILAKRSPYKNLWKSRKEERRKLLKERHA